MSDSKAVGSIEKSNLLSIIFAVKLGLWVSKMMNSGVIVCFAASGVEICLLDTKKFCSSHIWATAK